MTECEKKGNKSKYFKVPSLFQAGTLLNSLWARILGRLLLLLQVASVMSDSVRLHRRQPTRLPCPWDSPGKNTGVGYHFLLQCMKMKSESEATQSCLTLSNPMDCSLPGSSIHGILQARVLQWGAIAFIYIYINTHTHTHTHTHTQREREHAHSIWKQEITHSFLYEYEPFSIRDHNLGHKEASVNLRKI